MSENPEEPGKPPAAALVYAIRFSTIARRDILAEVARLGEIGGKSLAASWHDGIVEVAGTLAQLPYRNAIMPDVSRWMQRPTRHLIWRRSHSSTTAYLLFYSVVDAGEDGPVVTILHVRHGAQRPLTQKEARQMRSEL